MARRLLALLLPTLLLAAPAAAMADDLPLRPRGEDGPLGNERLSNETTLSRWANTNLPARIRSEPSRQARQVGRLHWNTEDGVPEVYLVLTSRLDAQGRAWLEIRVPGRPNGRTGWVPEEALSQLHVVRKQLVIDRRKLRATLYDRGRRIWSSPVGVGKRSTPTPGGRFWIRERLSNLRGDPLYGPWAFGTAAYSRLSEWPGGGVVGIHGTNQPWLIPGRPSHGCVRLPNRKITQLRRLLPIGTPLRIL
jgi:hypothetical protein